MEEVPVVTKRLGGSHRLSDRSGRGVASQRDPERRDLPRQVALRLGECGEDPTISSPAGVCSFPSGSRGRVLGLYAQLTPAWAAQGPVPGAACRVKEERLS